MPPGRTTVHRLWVIPCAAAMLLASGCRGIIGRACACPFDVPEVPVVGEINGRWIDERFSSCMCGDGKRAARAALVVLRTHPPFQTTNGGA